MLLKLYFYRSQLRFSWLKRILNLENTLHSNKMIHLKIDAFADLMRFKVINVVLNYVTLSEGLICHLRKEDSRKFLSSIILIIWNVLLS